MRALTKILVLASAIALAGCASTGSKSRGETSASAAEALRTCERIVYWSPDAPREQVLHCADILGLWR